MAKILKRVGSDFKINDTGQTVPGNGELTIDPSRYSLYARSNDVITALSDGDLTYNDGGAEDLELAKAIAHLQGSFPDFPITDSQKIPKFAIYKGEGSDFTRCSHDYADRTTWYTDSVRVVGESPTLDTGLIYNLDHSNVIDLNHGKVYKEDDLSAPYLPVVYDGGSPISGYSLDYANGTLTLDAAPSGAVTIDYSYEYGGTYILEPDAGKTLYLEHAEIQFSKDIVMKPMCFEIWVYNPLFDPGESITADNPDYIPGYTQGENPLRMRYQKTVYKNVKDLINSANLGQGVIPAIDILLQDTVVFPFNYVFVKPLKSSLGAQLRIRNVDEVPFGGSFGTVTFYCLSEDE